MDPFNAMMVKSCAILEFLGRSKTQFSSMSLEFKNRAVSLAERKSQRRLEPWNTVVKAGGEAKVSVSKVALMLCTLITVTY